MCGSMADIQSPIAEIRRGNKKRTRMWANTQRDGRPAAYGWRPLFNAAVWLTPTTRVPCSNAAKTGKPLKFAGVPQTPEPISAVSRPKFTILRGHVKEVLLFVAALRSRCGHFCFCPVISIFLLSFFPRPISAAAGWMSTIL